MSDKTSGLRAPNLPNHMILPIPGRSDEIGYLAKVCRLFVQCHAQTYPLIGKPADHPSNRLAMRHPYDYRRTSADAFAGRFREAVQAVKRELTPAGEPRRFLMSEDLHNPTKFINSIMVTSRFYAVRRFHDAGEPIPEYGQEPQPFVVCLKMCHIAQMVGYRPWVGDTLPLADLRSEPPQLRYNASKAIPKSLKWIPIPGTCYVLETEPEAAALTPVGLVVDGNRIIALRTKGTEVLREVQSKNFDAWRYYAQAGIDLNGSDPVSATQTAAAVDAYLGVASLLLARKARLLHHYPVIPQVSKRDLEWAMDNGRFTYIARSAPGTQDSGYRLTEARIRSDFEGWLANNRRYQLDSGQFSSAVTCLTLTLRDAIRKPRADYGYTVWYP